MEEKLVTRAAVNDCVSFLRGRLCGNVNASNRSLPLLPDAEHNRRALQNLLTHTIVDGYNNSALLLGPRGCGKTMVLDCVLEDLQELYPERFLTVRLSGLLHLDDYSALKEIARQLCLEYDLLYSRTASFIDNLQFFSAMLRECALSHKAALFVLDEFDLFSQRSKQCLLYNLLDAMQSPSSQIAVIGLSARLDADQLLEKRVRSRFSHRKYLFLPPLVEDVTRLLQDMLTLPVEPAFGHPAYAAHFNGKLRELLVKTSMRQLINKFTEADLSPRSVLDLGFRAICNMNRDAGVLTEANFKAASQALRRRPKRDALRDASVLELYLLVAMSRLEGKGREEYNFNIVFREYEQLSLSHSTCDNYSRVVAQRAFEHLLDRELVAFREKSGALEFSPVRSLISRHELMDGLKANPMCPWKLGADEQMADKWRKMACLCSSSMSSAFDSCVSRESRISFRRKLNQALHLRRPFCISGSLMKPSSSRHCCSVAQAKTSLGLTSSGYKFCTGRPSKLLSWLYGMAGIIVE